MAWRTAWRAAALACIAWLTLPGGDLSALAQTPRREIVVVTSFPSTFYEPFRRAFEQREPGYRLRIHNRKTTAAIEQVMGDGRFAHADIFWASAPDAFGVLKAAGRLATLDARVDTPETAIGGFPLDDPDGLFRGFAVSGYGMMWNETVLNRASAPAPQAIADLASPRFHGLIAMSAPSRSGTTHLMVETVLQRYGWRQGWGLWLRLAGNLATITARSFSVTSGVEQGRFAVGLSIDFLGRGNEDNGRLGFAYPAETVFLPASIAMLSAANEPGGAKRFAQFVLSKEGQALLADPKIRRQPLIRQPRGAAAADLFGLAAKGSGAAQFDARLSGRRYELVNLLFDELITERLMRLQRFWSRAAEIRAIGAADPALAAEIAAAEAEATRIPDEIASFGDTLPEWPLRRVPRGVPPPAQQAALIERLRRDADVSLAAAEQRLEALGKRLAVGQPPAGSLR